MLWRTSLVLVVVVVMAGVVSGAEPAAVIVTPADASAVETLAAREVRRYVYLRTGKLMPIQAQAAGEGPRIIVARKGRQVMEADGPTRAAIDALEAQQYVLKTVENGRTLLAVGADDVGTLYAAYRLAEHLGVGFAMQGDIVPDQQTELTLPKVDEVGKPLFELRGIQPFHDFPEGPDWWDLDDYRAIIGQLPKMRMNFFGLHTYPEGGVGPEPTVWIGQSEDIGTDGKVKFAYSSSWLNTLRGNWGYAAKKTGDYVLGASQLFEEDAYGNEVMRGLCPRPGTAEGHIEVFNRSGAFLREAFGHARLLGVKTCVGTETPLIVPELVRLRMEAVGKIKSWVNRRGGKTAHYNSPIAKTEDDALYQSVRWDVAGYDLLVPNGTYAVTLKFSEVAYDRKGARVFGVKVQGQQVIDRLDIFGEVGKNVVLDRKFENVKVVDGKLAIDFVPIVEFPCVAGIVVEGAGFVGKINCGGGAYKDYVPDGAYLGKAEVQALYEGMFQWIAKNYPLDYYWLWTPEDWTWSGASDEQVQRTVEDLQAAIAAAKKVNAPFGLATCGWVLGPPKDRALFDNVLPKEMPVSCINRQVGKDFVEPGFAKVQGRGKWAIPWMEDDPNLLSPQLWAGRMRKDAADAMKYGCTGLFGIHWRTRILDPNVSALAKAAWDQKGWNNPQDASQEKSRHLPTDDFYREWAKVQFGAEAAEEIAKIFAKIDGRLPEPSNWIDGPGGIKADGKPWGNAGQLYGFVDEMAALRPRIKGAGNLERFDYWLNNFRYMKATEKVKWVWARYNEALKATTRPTDARAKAEIAEKTLLPIRRELVAAVGEVYGYMLATVTTPGELGTVANWEQHILPGLIERPGKELAAMLGRELPADAQLSKSYSGPLKLIVPTQRTSAKVGERIRIKAMVLSARPVERVSVMWRPMGQGEFKRIMLERQARGVYLGTLPMIDAGLDAIEYYVEVFAQDGESAVFPPAAPRINQTVVVW